MRILHSRNPFQICSSSKVDEERLKTRIASNKTLVLTRFGCRIAVAAFTWLALLVVAPAQQATKVPASVVVLAKKYDETREKTLGPILDSLSEELKLKTMPALTRAGKAAVAVQIGESLDKLKSVSPVVLPRAGAPFPPAAWADVEQSAEWSVFVAKFSKAEAMLNESYMKALEIKKAEFQGKGDAYGVVAVENELMRVKPMAEGTPNPVVSSASIKPSSTSQPNGPPAAIGEPVTAAKRKEVELWLEGTTWKSGKALFYFAKEGKGVAKVPSGEVVLFSDMKGGGWRVQNDGSVELLAPGPYRTFTLETPESGAFMIHDKAGGEPPALKFTKVANDPEMVKALK